MTNKESKYEAHANKLAKAVDVAEQILKESPDFKVEFVKSMIDYGRKIKQAAINPEPQFRKLVSLKYLENDFFIFWNESSGPEVDKFWNQIVECNLGYVRKDAIHDVLKRKKIKNIHEFDFIIDNIVVYEQTGRLNQGQLIALNSYIGEFEKRESRK